MTDILNNFLYTLLLAPIEYILNSLIILFGLIIEAFILTLATPTGIISAFSVTIIIEFILAESIAKDIKNLVIYAILPRLRNIRHKYLTKVEFMPKQKIK